MLTFDDCQGKEKRVCHLTTVHSRGDTRIWIKECVSLAAAGYDVHLVVGDGLGDAVVDGIQIHDIGHKPESRIKRMLLQSKRAERKVLQLKPEVVHFHDPELLPVGVRLARNGMRVIYDAHEDVPRQIQNKYWIPRFFRSLVGATFEAYENRAVAHLAGVVAATPHIEHRFSGRGISTVGACNYPLLEELLPSHGEVDREKRVCYVGMMARIRGLHQVIRALPLVPDVRLTLCGPIGEADLDAELRSEPGWAQVDYLGIVDRAAVRRAMGKSSAGLVTFLSEPNHLEALPNKLFEYMSAGLPVIASDFPSWRKIIDGAGCGLCVNPESPDAIAAAIRQLIDSPRDAGRMGRAGREAVVGLYNWPTEAKKLLEFYKVVA